MCKEGGKERGGGETRRLGGERSGKGGGRKEQKKREREGRGKKEGRTGEKKRGPGIYYAIPLTFLKPSTQVPQTSVPNMETYWYHMESGHDLCSCL